MSVFDLDSSTYVPKNCDLRATCFWNEAMMSALNKFSNTIKVRKLSIDFGRAVRNFGVKNDILNDKIVQIYMTEEAVCKTSLTFD